MGDVERESAGERRRPAGPVGGIRGTPHHRAAWFSLGEQIGIVLALSVLESAAFAVISLLEAPVDRSVSVAVFPSFDLARQLVSIAFGLAPVWLVVYLVRRPGEGGLASIGISADRPALDTGWGAGLALVTGAAGLGLYVAAVHLGVNRLVVPVPPLGHWWTVPVLVMGSVENALLEEVVAVGYLLTRLRRLGWVPWATIAASAVLRGTYHLYQGWGGFTGNVALGVVFGWVFLRTGRLWPLVLAHALLDVGAGVGYIALCPQPPYC